MLCTYRTFCILIVNVVYLCTSLLIVLQCTFVYLCMYVHLCTYSTFFWGRRVCSPSCLPIASTGHVNNYFTSATIITHFLIRIRYIIEWVNFTHHWFYLQQNKISLVHVKALNYLELPHKRRCKWIQIVLFHVIIWSTKSGSSLISTIRIITPS